jgi:hypothetical protein
LKEPQGGGAERKMIETQFDRTNVPKREITVAEALAAIHCAARGKGSAPTIRRALLAVLAFLENDA